MMPYKKPSLLSLFLLMIPVIFALGGAESILYVGEAMNYGAINAMSGGEFAETPHITIPEDIDLVIRIFAALAGTAIIAHFGIKAVLAGGVRLMPAGDSSNDNDHSDPMLDALRELKSARRAQRNETSNSQVDSKKTLHDNHADLLEEFATQYQRAVSKYTDVNKVYLDTEMNPETILLRPLILDVSYSLTEEFHQNRETASVLMSSCSQKLDKKKISEKDMAELNTFTDAVEMLDNSWMTLWARATDEGIPGITTDKNRQAKSLLAMILDPSTTASEREVSRNRLDRILDTYLGAKPAWKSKVDAVIREELTNKGLLSIEPSDAKIVFG